MRPITVSIGPSLSSTANNIATSQTPAGTSGRAAATFTANNPSIAATNAFVAGQPVTFLNVGGTANSGSPPLGAPGIPGGFTPASTYYVIATGLTTTHFEVSTTVGGSAVTPTSAGTGTQYVLWGANVALNGTLVNATTGIVTLPTPQRVLITTNDTTHTFTINGTDSSGAVTSETLTASTTVQSKLDWATITSIVISGGLTAAVTIGTNGVGSTPWARMDEWANTQITMQFDVTGTVNYTVQSSMDDPNSATNPVIPSAVTWVSTNDTNVVGATSSLQSNYLFAPTWIRVLLNSGSGSVTATIAQANVASR
jgi:hypothetical protein